MIINNYKLTVTTLIKYKIQRSHPTEDSCSISPDQVEIQSAIHLKMDFGRHLEVVSLEATEEILAVASVPQAP